jgi:hypothetical protein
VDRALLCLWLVDCLGPSQSLRVAQWAKSRCSLAVLDGSLVCARALPGPRQLEGDTRRGDDFEEPRAGAVGVGLKARRQVKGEAYIMTSMFVGFGKMQKIDDALMLHCITTALLCSQ